MMKITPPKIFIQDWLELKPYQKQVASDVFYLQLSNKIKNALLDHLEKDFFDLLNEDGLKSLSCLLASYLEDLVSNTNIWNTFVRCHNELYGKPLPFYTPTDYYTGEINLQDIQFLLWYFRETQEVDLEFSPLDEGLREIAEQLLPLLDEAWEHAPENTALLPYYTVKKGAIFFEVRTFMQHVMFTNYLFHEDTNIELEYERDKMFKELNAKGEDSNYIQAMIYSLELDKLQSVRTRLLAFSAKEWASNMLGEKHPLYNSIQEMSPRVSSTFLYTGHSSKYLFTEHLATGMKFNIRIDSYPEHQALPEDNSIMAISIIQWQGDWWFSGSALHAPYDEKFVSRERRSFDGLKAFYFLKRNKGEEDTCLQEKFDFFLKFTNGKQILFVKEGEGEKIIDDFHNYFQQAISSKNNKEEIPDPTRWWEHANHDNIDKYEEGEVLFYNPIMGVELFDGYTSAFPSDSNPFFSQDQCNDDVFKLLENRTVSPELVRFWMDHYKKDCPLDWDELDAYFSNFDFMLRFWKNEYYETQSSIFLLDKDADISI